MTGVSASDRRLQVSLLAATLLLAAATVALASVPPRPLRSALTVVSTLSIRVATDWLVVVALLGVADGYVRDRRTVDRSTVTRLAVAVFLGGLAVEAAPVARLAVGPTPAGPETLVSGFVGALQGALLPAGLFVATVTGAAALRERADPPGLPLAPQRGYPAPPPDAVWRALRVLVAVAGSAFALEVAVRLALGTPYPWLVVLDGAVGTARGLVDAAVLSVAFLLLAASGATARSVALGVVGVWAALFVLAFAVAAAGAALAVGLVGATTTPMAAVEGSALGEWPTPDSWAILLGMATFVAGGAGLATVQRTTRDDRTGGAETGTRESRELR